jgi:hypothetical protein
MTGKASNTKTTVDIIKKQKRDQKRAAGLSRQNLTGFSSGQASSSIRSPVTSGSSAGSNTGNFIRSSGDTMVGPLAFYFQSKYIASGTLDISEETGAYSSRVIVIGQGGAADDLEVILGASHAGQILFFQPIQAVTLQSFLKTAAAWASGTSYSIGDVVLYNSQRYTCYVAHTSSGSILPTDTTKWYRNNIRITGATEQVVAVDEIILLQYDSSDGVWTVVSGGGSGSSGAGLGDANVWTGTNTFQDVVSMTGSTVNIGDATTDRVNFISKLGTDIDLNDYDIENIDRLFFSTSGTDNLTASDMGIAANSNDNDYLTYNVPSGYHRFKVNGNLAMSVGPTSNPGLTVENSLWVSGSITATGNVTFQQEVTLGNSSSDDINIVGNIDTDISMAASKKIRAYTSTEIGYYVKNATSSVGSEGTIQIPTKNSGVGNASAADSDFGSEIGCIGLYTLGNPTLVIKYSSSGWQGIIFGSSGNPTQYQF